MEAFPNLTDLSHKASLALAYDLLNRTKKYDLIPYSGSLESPDFIQNDPKGNVKVALQIITRNNINAKTTKEFIFRISGAIDILKPQQYFLINFSNTFSDELKSLTTTSTATQFIYYDLAWVLEQLNNHPDIAENHKISLQNPISIKTNVQHQESTSGEAKITVDSDKVTVDSDTITADSGNKNEPIIDFLNQNRNFFAAGYDWDGESQEDRFLENNIWENGKGQEDAKTVNKAIKGDVVFLKATFVKDNKGSLRVKAFGVVSQNSKNGESLNVNWHKHADINLPGAGAYRSAFGRVISDNNKLKILTGIYKEVPDLFEIIEKLGNIADDELKPEKRKDKIPFHLDQVSDEDKLGREPVAVAFVDLLKKDIFTEELNHSFMVHLQGEWGAGKSSFLNFIENNLNTEKENWIVVKYNAWQNQHISPPWWTLIDQIYRQSKSELTGSAKYKLWRKEFFRRVIWHRGWQKILTLVLTIVFTLILINYGNSIIDFISNATGTETNNTPQNATLSVFAKLIITLGSTVGVIYSLSRFISTPFFMKSSAEADSFMNKASDPMARIKKHFDNLIDDINSKKENRQLAIFIDDIDRCNKEFIVRLLEGIQTLFKEKRVLYIVAGDKKWITTSFGNTYKEFSSIDSDNNQLGELFLEKAFQLSIRMPNISDRSKEQYWSHILGSTPEIENKKKGFSDLDLADQVKVTEKLSTASEDISTPDFMDSIEKEFNLTEDEVSNLVIKKKNESVSEIVHLLKDFHSLIEANPRSIKRLANHYTMTRSTLIAERKVFNPDKLFRWLAMVELYPNLVNSISSFDKLEDINRLLFDKGKNKATKEKCMILLYDKDLKNGGSLTLEEIKDFEGIA